MTDPNYTALLLVIDRSGSMADIRDDMVGGLNTMLAEQMAEPGLLTVDVVTFDDKVELQCSLANPKNVVITLEPRGRTALFDAVGQAVTGFGQVLAALPEHARPETVQVIVVTDGHENASQEYRANVVRELVTRQKNEFSWDFVFLGANQDAVLSGESLGFDRGSSMTFLKGKAGVDSMNSSMGRYMKDVRSKTKRDFMEAERRAAMEDPEAPVAEAGEGSEGNPAA